MTVVLLDHGYARTHVLSKRIDADTLEKAHFGRRPSEVEPLRKDDRRTSFE